MWDILKHEKDQYISFIKDITYTNEASDEMSLHHDYSINKLIQPQKIPDKSSSSQIISRQLVILICLVTR